MSNPADPDLPRSTPARGPGNGSAGTGGGRPPRRDGVGGGPGEPGASGGSRSGARSGSAGNRGGRRPAQGASGKGRGPSAGTGSRTAGGTRPPANRDRRPGVSSSEGGRTGSAPPVSPPSATAPGARDEAGLGDQEAAAANRRRAWTLTWAAALVAGVIVGAVVWATAGAIAGLAGGAVALIGFGLWTAGRARSIVPRSVRARAVTPGELPRLHNLVEGLCAVMGLPVPTVMVVDSPVPNAVSSGNDPRRAALVVTAALPERLSLVELESVLAHELVHIKRRDGAPAGVAVALASLLPMRTSTASSLVHRTIGPGREYRADQRAAAVVRSPMALGSALRTLIDVGRGRDPWPEGAGRVAALTRWLWIDPPGGEDGSPPADRGGLDGAPVRVDVLALL